MYLRNTQEQVGVVSLNAADIRVGLSVFAEHTRTSGSSFVKCS